LSKLDPPIQLGVANVLQYHKFWDKFNIGGTPELIWFDHGKQFTYTGSRTKDDIVKWVKDNSKKQATGDADDASKDDTGGSPAPKPKEKPKEVPHDPTFSKEALARIKMLKGILKDPDSSDEMKK